MIEKLQYPTRTLYSRSWSKYLYKTFPPVFINSTQVSGQNSISRGSIGFTKSHCHFSFQTSFELWPGHTFIKIENL
jgi:hypothetical protein